MITYRGNEFVKESPLNHTHQPDFAFVEAVKTIEELKLRSAIYDEASSYVIQNVTKSISIVAVVNFQPRSACLKWKAQA